MLSYLHQFHAGNHADVLKHWVLLECLHYMQQKEAAMDCIDTHAGAGIYRLKSAEARKNAEHEQGIVKALGTPGLDLLSGFMGPYLSKHQYAGSAEIIRAHLRPQDRAWLYELHPASFKQLTHAIAVKPPRIYARQEDGLAALPGLLPSQKKRALIIMDPPYEVKHDYQAVAETACSAWRRMPGAMILVWYPVVEGPYAAQLTRTLKAGPIKDILRLELGVRPAGGMFASGMLVVNPPWTLKEKARNTLPLAAAALNEQAPPYWLCEQWVEE